MMHKVGGHNFQGAGGVTMIDVNNIRRRGVNTIVLGNGLTAREGWDGLPTLEIRRDRAVLASYRGSSLHFSEPLTPDDCSFLASLARRLDG